MTVVISKGVIFINTLTRLSIICEIDIGNDGSRPILIDTINIGGTYFSLIRSRQTAAATTVAAAAVAVAAPPVCMPVAALQLDSGKV